MAKIALDTIRDAESRASDIIEQAHQDASDIVSNANKQAELDFEMEVEQTRQKFAQEVEQLEIDLQAQAAVFDDETDKMTKELRNKLMQKQETAVQAVIQTISE